jgi:hypothetical protein
MPYLLPEGVTAGAANSPIFLFAYRLIGLLAYRLIAGAVTIAATCPDKVLRLIDFYDTLSYRVRVSA